MTSLECVLLKLVDCDSVRNTSAALYRSCRCLVWKRCSRREMNTFFAGWSLKHKYIQQMAGMKKDTRLEKNDITINYRKQHLTRSTIK